MKILKYASLLLLLSCMSKNKINIDDCEIYLQKNSNFSLIQTSLNKQIEDSTLSKEFINGEKNNSSYIKDKINNWEKTFSSDYFDASVKSFTGDYVLIYCPHSGIKNGYKLFPKWSHDVYLISRKDGQTIKIIKIKKGLAAGLIQERTVFLKFLDPEEIRMCNF